MSNDIITPPAQRTTAQLLQDGGRLTVCGSDSRGYAATISDADGEPIRTEFAATISGALRRLDAITPRRYPPIGAYWPKGAY